VSGQDPYERGFEVTRRRQLDLTKLDVDNPYGAKPPPRISWRWLLALLGIVVVLAIGRSVRNSSDLRPDCTRLQVAVAESSVRTSAPDLVHWSVTGPAGTSYLVALDPHGSHRHTRTTQLRRMPSRCFDAGTIGVLAPPGRYDVTLYRVSGRAETPVVSKPVTVTGD
jgi:hypothetical protein